MIKRLEDQTSQELTRIMKHRMLKRPTGVDQPEATEEEVEEVRNSCDEALVSTQPAKIPLRLTLDIEAIDQ